MLQPDTLLNDRYRLQERIGEGGMATVWRAIDTRLGRTVAIKILDTQFARDQPFLQRFQQEAEFAASLGAHPDIVAIYDIGEDDPWRYIVMELVEGQSLKELIGRRAPFPVPEAFAIGQQVASALDFAHRRGLVHRDIKPQNIMVTPEGVAKVTDFGIARSLSTSQLTRTGMVIGTVHYFSPEQAQGKPATAASDIYSLGIILYEMLTAHLPFDAENAIGVAMQHVHSEPPPPWDYNRELPARAVAVVMRALEKDPERRYRDAAEFASALSTQAEPNLGATTTFSPIQPPPTPRQQTSSYEAVPPAPRRPVRRVVVDEPERPARPTRPVAVQQPNSMRTMWLALAGVIALLAIAAGAFLVTTHAFGGATATSTPTPTATATGTPTATPKPKPKRHRPTPTATHAAIVPPTMPPTPTATPTATPVPPTFTPTPRPTATPRPTPTPHPTATPKPPQPTPTPKSLPVATDTPSPTPVG